ncbi:TLC domain-containing protein 2-like [Tachypleus tridentatus]|uniref:TLC domain-containing protein 2-like n=1 Tax=Tachypleus tridentatus TaxID=6853 RepID=UPI003FD45D7A
MAEDMIEIHTNKSHLLVAFSTGYFIYDFIDMSSNHRCRNSYELMVHHAFVILCFGITMYKTIRRLCFSCSTCGSK